MQRTSSRRLVIKNGQLVSPKGIVRGDLLMVGQTITRVGGMIDSQGVDEIDASGLYVLPGVIDCHVHFREPGPTHKESIASGSRAAVIGGVTSYLEMPNTSPPTTTQERLEQKRAIAAKRSFANYGFFIGATSDNLDVLKAAQNTPGIKVFVGSSTGNLLVEQQAHLERIFAEGSLPIAVHAEDEEIIQANLERYKGLRDPSTHSKVRTPQAAAKSVQRLCQLASESDRRLHILHMSTRAELEATANCAVVTKEVCIPHLFLDTTAYTQLGNRAKVNPAVRERSEVEALWAALRKGEYQLVATDHAPHTVEEKAQPYPEAPSGIPSIENSLPLMLDSVNRGRLTLPELVRLMAEGPAQTWQIRNKGRLKEGYDADLTLVDLKLKRTIEDSKQWSKAGWSPWNGRSITGWPVRTIIMGKTVVKNGQIVAAPSGQSLQFGED